MSSTTKDMAKPPRVGKPKEEAKTVTSAKSKMIGKINLNETSVDKADAPQSTPVMKPTTVKVSAQPKEDGIVMTEHGVDIVATLNNRKPEIPDQPPTDPFIEELRKLHNL